jgi:hypothetical protein
MRSVEPSSVSIWSREPAERTTLGGEVLGRHGPGASFPTSERPAGLGGASVVAVCAERREVHDRAIAGTAVAASIDAGRHPNAAAHRPSAMLAVRQPGAAEARPPLTALTDALQGFFGAGRRAVGAAALGALLVTGVPAVAAPSVAPAIDRTAQIEHAYAEVVAKKINDYAHWIQSGGGPQDERFRVFDALMASQRALAEGNALAADRALSEPYPALPRVAASSAPIDLRDLEARLRGELTRTMDEIMQNLASPAYLDREVYADFKRALCIRHLEAANAALETGDLARAQHEVSQAERWSPRPMMPEGIQWLTAGLFLAAFGSLLYVPVAIGNRGL